MAQTLYFHVGTNKTGTSAIQKFLAKVSHKLTDQNCIYPSCFRDSEFNTAHHKLSQLLKVNRFDKTCADALKQEILESKCENVILSSEDFHTIKDTDDFEPLFNCFEKINIIIYIRDCFSYSLSWYQQNSQFKGSSLYFDDFVYLLQPNLVQTVKNLLSLKSNKINLIVREYDRSKFKNESILYDFTSLLPLTSEYSDNLISTLVEETLFQNPSICGNLLYLRKLQSATYNDRSIIKESYNFFTMASAVNKECFQGLCYVELNDYPNLVTRFTKQNEFFNNKFGMNLELAKLKPKKMAPNFKTLERDFTKIESMIDRNNKFQRSLLPLLDLKKSFND